MPIEVREEIKLRFEKLDFHSFRDLAKELNERGYKTSKTSLHNYYWQLKNPDSKPAERPTLAKPPAKMPLHELENESQYLKANLPILEERQRAVEAELNRRYNGAETPPRDTGKPSMKSKINQKEAVRAALLAGKPVNQVEAIRQGWGLRLSALIYRLRGEGLSIHTERDHGSGLARYSLTSEARQ